MYGFQSRPLRPPPIGSNSQNSLISVTTFTNITNKQALRKLSEAAQVKFVNERFRKYSKVTKELLTFEKTKF